MCSAPKPRVKNRNVRRKRKASTHHWWAKSSHRFFRRNLEKKHLKERRGMITKGHSLAISKQCELLRLKRSSYYYQVNSQSSLNLELMRLIDEHYLKHPYYGSKKMHKSLTMNLGYNVSLKRINRIYYSVMGLQSVLPGKKIITNLGHTVPLGACPKGIHLEEKRSLHSLIFNCLVFGKGSVVT